MNQTLYYVKLGDEQFGPFLLDTIIGIHLTHDIAVRSTITNRWLQACEYHELTSSLDYSLYELHQNLFKKKDKDNKPNYNNQETTDKDVQENNTPNEDKNQEENNDEIKHILNQVCSLLPTDKQIFRRVFPTKEAERDFLISEYNQIFTTLLNLVKDLEKACKKTSINHRATTKITNSVNGIAKKINEHYISSLDHLYTDCNTFTTASIQISQTIFTFSPPLQDVELSRMDFLKVLADKNLCVTYESDSENIAFDFINNIVGKLYEANAARIITTYVIDTNFMTGIDDSFKLLNRDLYTVITRPDEVRETLSSMQNRASTILRNLLVEKDYTLQDYNTTHDNKETNILLIFKGFPCGLTNDNLESLYKLMKVGPKVGIYIMILTHKDFVDSMTSKETEAFNWNEFSKVSNSFLFESRNDDIFGSLNSESSNNQQGEVLYETLSNSDIRKIVKDVNARCELKEDVIITISDHLPNRAEWWSHDSAKQIEIPFGIGNDMHIKSLKITQESGQNTAVVIGIPGSGKSVFLHSLIISAAIKYSPDEVRMYLIDFSGVEFNSYALGKLPHARVIAPEAEREFGLSILNELVEEGTRRMVLCRDHNVSNIVDLKRVAPGIKVPRLLVIIAEFQKLFEIENDIIAREANSKIHIIIQEFRKFGINLILATQKLPAGSFLPRDLIANRVVFKSAPNDFNALISLENKSGIPRLRTGQCIYNCESGTPYANEKVQGFFVSREQIDQLLSDLNDFGRSQVYEREHIKVFRSNKQPDFQQRRILSHHHGYRLGGQAVPIYVGESISVSDYDVCLELNHEGGNNLLIVGGESAVAEAICYHSILSISTCHDANDATFIVLNGMRSDNKTGIQILETISSLPFPSVFPTRIEDIEQTLTSIKETIDERRSSGETNYNNIYLTIFEAQNVRAFDQVSNGRTERPSQSATLLDSIVKNGPSVGIFTIMQIDNLSNLTRIGSLLPSFNHRVALQMPDRDSTIIIGSEAANKLFVFNRPSSIFRAYLYDKQRNTNIKFKPYKL